MDHSLARNFLDTLALSSDLFFARCHAWSSMFRTPNEKAFVE